MNINNSLSLRYRPLDKLNTSATDYRNEVTMPVILFEISDEEKKSVIDRIERASERVEGNCLEFKSHNTIYFRGKNHCATRLVWKLHNEREVAPGFVVRHKCKTKFCVNPAHLEVGTHRQNMLEDKIRDGTLKTGEEHHNSKITNSVAKKIYESRGNGTRKERARLFGVSEFMVKKIDCGATWSYVTGNHAHKNKRREALYLAKGSVQRKDLTREDFANAIDRMQKKSFTTAIGCIKSTFAKSEDGYGIIGVSKHQFRTHVISAIYFLNDFQLIDKDKVVGHLCEQGKKNRDCHNPNHLKIMSNSENQIYRHKTITDEQIKQVETKHDFWQETVTKKRKRELETQEFVCEQCEQVLRGEKSLAAHIKLEHTQWPCSICWLKCRTRSAMNYHKQKQHSQRPVKQSKLE